MEYEPRRAHRADLPPIPSTMLYDVIAGLLSIALQYGAPFEKLGDLLAGAKIEPLRTDVWA
jgi:hypothetical protein